MPTIYPSPTFCFTSHFLKKGPPKPSFWQLLLHPSASILIFQVTWVSHVFSSTGNNSVFSSFSHWLSKLCDLAPPFRRTYQPLLSGSSGCSHCTSLYFPTARTQMHISTCACFAVQRRPYWWIHWISLICSVVCPRIQAPSLPSQVPPLYWWCCHISIWAWDSYVIWGHC